MMYFKGLCRLFNATGFLAIFIDKIIMVAVMKRYLLITALVCFTRALSAQTHNTDSLKNLIHAAKTDKARLKAILTLCKEFETLPKDTLWNYALKANALADATKDQQGKSLAILAQAQAWLRWDNSGKALALIAPELLKYKVENNDTRDTYFKLLQFKIDCTGYEYDYKNAIAQVYKVLRDAERYKDSIVMAESMNTLAAWNYDMDFLKEGRTWGYKGIAVTSPAPKFYASLTALYLNLAENYRWIGKTDSAAFYVDKAIVLSKKIQNLFYLSMGLQRRASVYIDQKNYAGAEKAILESISVMAKVDGQAPQPEKYMVLASVYKHSGQIDKAIGVLNNGLRLDSVYANQSPRANQHKNDADLQKVFYYQELAECYHLKGDSKNYEKYLEKIIAGKDAFYKANSAQAIAELETKYETQKNEATITHQRLLLLKENYLFYGSVLVLILSAAIIILLFRDYKRRQKLNLKQLQEEQKRLAALAVASAEETERKRIAADLHDNLGAQLSFIKRNVNFILDHPAGFNPGDERKYLSSVNDIAQNAMIDLRETIWVLNKDEVTVQEFADKLKSYLRQQLAGKENITWDFTEKILVNWKLSSGEVMHMFRIIQELISNVIKHSHGDLLSVDFVSLNAGSYKLQVCDNGIGFDAASKHEGHYGMDNIEQRAKDILARILIKSGTSAGTTVVLLKD